MSNEKVDDIIDKLEDNVYELANTSDNVYLSEMISDPEEFAATKVDITHVVKVTPDGRLFKICNNMELDSTEMLGQFRSLDDVTCHHVDPICNVCQHMVSTDDKYNIKLNLSTHKYESGEIEPSLTITRIK
jgi:hypothetical protein